MTEKEYVETVAKNHYIEYLAERVAKKETAFEDALKKAKLLNKEHYFRTRYSELMSYWV